MTPDNLIYPPHRERHPTRKRQLGAEELRQVRSLLSYCPLTGRVAWRVDRNSRTKAGITAGCAWRVTGGSYWFVTCDGRRYHRAVLAVALMTGDWPGFLLAHRDGDRLNDTWANLAYATATRVQHETARLRKPNAVGLQGVYVAPRSRRKPYRAAITIGGQYQYLGSFATAEAASAAYQAAKLAYLAPGSADTL